MRRIPPGKRSHGNGDRGDPLNQRKSPQEEIHDCELTTIDTIVSRIIQPIQCCFFYFLFLLSYIRIQLYYLLFIIHYLTHAAAATFPQSPFFPFSCVLIANNPPRTKASIMIMLCYHDLARDEVNPWTLHPAKFREQLQVLQDQNYRIIALDQIDHESLHDSKTAVISFDDGRASCLHIAAAILDEFQYRACFYVCTGFAEGVSIPNQEQYSLFMNWNEIRQLRNRGHVIGSHAATHRSFQELDSEMRFQELLVSKGIIEDRLDCSCHHFAAPYGYSDAALRLYTQNSGYTTLATTIFGVNRSATNLFQLRRWEIHANLTRDEFTQHLDTLEKMSDQYRVLFISQSNHSPKNGMNLERIAQFDLTVLQEPDMVATLQQLGIHCKAASSLPFDMREIASNTERLAGWVKERVSGVSDLHVMIEVI